MSKRTILVIDDEQPIQRVLRRILEREGYQVVTAGSVPVAEEILAEIKVDAVLCDQMLPGENGISFLERLAGSDPNLPRILATGYGDLQVAKLAINRARVQAFISKPFEPEEILDCLRSLLGAEPIAPGRRPSSKPADGHLRRLREEYPGIEVVNRNTQGCILLGEQDPPHLARPKTPEMACMRKAPADLPQPKARKAQEPRRRPPRQPTALRELEAAHPGISSVARSATGSIVLDEEAYERFVDTSEYKRPSRIESSANGPRKQPDTLVIEGLGPNRSLGETESSRYMGNAPDRRSTALDPLDDEVVVDVSLLKLIG
jgi:CheY-like chemotaxis protein